MGGRQQLPDLSQIQQWGQYPRREHHENGRSLEEENGTVALLVREINALSQAAALAFALKTGELVVRQLYRGDPKRWRKCGKTLSYRKLAVHPALSISAAQLHRSVCLYEMSINFGGLEKYGHLGIAHLRALIGLDEPDQRQLLEQGERECWTARRFERESRLRRQRTVRRTGRPSLPMPIKTVRGLERLLSRDALDAMSNPGGFGGGHAAEMREKIPELETKLKRILAGLEGIRRRL